MKKLIIYNQAGGEKRTVEGEFSYDVRPGALVIDMPTGAILVTNMPYILWDDTHEQADKPAVLLPI